MATIFEEARRRREKALEEATNPQAPPASATVPPPPVDFFRPKPLDPEAEAAKARKLAELLRKR
jgi:hypothetical protein